MVLALKILLGTFTLGLPVWFAVLDRKAAPRLKWSREGGGIPTWGHMVVVVGVVLAVLVALAEPMAGFHPSH